MEQSKLKKICGLTIKDAELTLGDLGISFSDGTSLAIYNMVNLVGFTMNDASMISGKAVVDVIESEHKIRIILKTNLAIEIDMNDEAYNGPEAIQLRVPGEPIVIWN